ncbi:MAG TPA: cofactor-independent phosphoglycerate mutase [Candidatus Aminicenantes bacterium]|nr:cofactor-independent phosphoglycerate mutase [Candidatus Aminicenantes bacterium]
MRYAFLVGDGMADRPLAELGGKTPLEYAATPNMDRVAALGRVGRVRTVPAGLPPGSDVANMSLLGYDAAAHFQGRGPIEAASLGVALAPDETAFRCNLVTLEGGLMADYSAGHITTAEARPVVLDLQAALGGAAVRFHPGVSYRHLAVMADFPAGLECTPPHDISGRPWEPHLPKGPGREAVLDLMARARPVLAAHPVNRRRVEAGRSPATDIWLWGQGRALRLATLRERYGLTGSVISAVDLVRGLGVLAGLKVRPVEGATGYLGTNYAGKVAAARAALAGEDFVYLHVEAPDEMSHEGRAGGKVQAIEEFDRFVVGEMLAWAREAGDARVVVATDHETPVAIRTHAGGPVPYAVCGPGVGPGGAAAFNEAAAAARPAEAPPEFFERVIRGTW